MSKTIVRINELEKENYKLKESRDKIMEHHLRIVDLLLDQIYILKLIKEDNK